MELDDAQTPLATEEFADLIPMHVVTRQDLNREEAFGFAQAWDKLVTESTSPQETCSVANVRRINREALKNVWKWAGRFRTTAKNIGVPAPYVTEELEKACRTAQTWIARRPFSDAALAVRFHYEIIRVHPFPNGNGRTGRLAADLLLVRLGGSVLPWGGAELSPVSQNRTRYIAAVRQADNGNFDPLIEFATSVS